MPKHIELPVTPAIVAGSEEDAERPRGALGPMSLVHPR